MKTLRLMTIVGLTLMLVATSAPASARQQSATHHTAKAKRKARRASRHPIFSGHLVSDQELRANPLPHPSGHLKLYSVNMRESLELELYDDKGMIKDDSVDALNHFWRCRRTGTEKPINPHLFEVLSLIQDHFNGATIELVSGFRNQERTTSYHFRGSASDIRLAGVGQRELHQYVTTLDTGNMGLGLYPRAGFIHVDVRPDSFRWVDWSPPSNDMGHPKKRSHKRHRNS